MGLIAILLLCGPHPLTHGLCVDQKTELSVCEQWVHCDWDLELVLYFDPQPKLEIREVELGYMDYFRGPPVLYYLRLQSGDRDEWIEVEDWQYNQAIIGEEFDRGY